MGVVAIPLIWGYVALRPQWFLRARDVYEQRFAGGEKYDQELKDFVRQSFEILIFLICLGLLGFVCVLDPPRTFIISEKIFLEDFLAVSIPAVFFSTSAVALVFYYFERNHRT
jgi:O-antigen/teichoic acid export membrane protein